MADYKMKVEKGITVTMRDGIKISLCVYRPDAPGQFPTLFAASPYQYEMDEVPAYPLFLWRETGPVEWYVSQGYSYVHADVRGSGQSEGEFSFMGLEEQKDYLELIAWIIKQPWCSGRVGGIGQSYYAMAQWLMATYNPPGLACIVPYDGLVDQYRGSNYHGGIYCSYRSVWYTTLRADNQHRPAGKHGRPPMKFDLVGEIINHELDDDFWRERSPYWRLDKIKCPVLSVGHWGKMGLHLRGNILGYEELKSPKKLVVTGARNTFEAHKMFDQVEFHEKELLPFYDLHLKGKNNGFMEAEPVKIFVRGANVWRAEEEWPPKRATYVPYYLRKGPSGSVTSMNDGGLSADKPAANEATTSYTYPDWEWVNGVAIMGPDGRVDPVRRVLTFTSAPLDADLDVTGPIVLKLFASSTAIDTQFIVKLTDQQPQDDTARKSGAQPGYVPVSKGWLKASHREKDTQRSTPTRPFYTHTNPQPLKPGEIYEFDIEVLPVSYVFKKGHRIRLEIAPSDSPATDGVFSHPYHPTQMGTDTFHHDAGHASCILLPVIR
ncbi:CocE/NonD family hydrolase [Rhodoplanes sp. Z2-YC6860]|uniref:CocE/NonD family hydrolase n=1 Tax=Rhodoplanes sp. Z2-YC6860 TaxID=674703 RepID=UPI000832B772|nr:CocE/NonD family hydrolase [Rhodoplanes sp. Z2-YC6860]